MQDSGGFWIIQGSVYAGFRFIQGSVYTGFQFIQGLMYRFDCIIDFIKKTGVS
jgi:virulence-associated protein VapD